MPVAIASPLAYATPTTSAPTSPGACVTAIASRSAKGSGPSSPSAAPARSIASSTTPTIASVCLRLAISGTTPPKRAWKSIWLATTLDEQLAAAAHHRGGGLVARRLDREDELVVGAVGRSARPALGSGQVAPHDDGVLAVPVVAGPHADRREPDRLVQRDRRGVLGADLERHALRAQLGAPRQQPRRAAPPDALAAARRRAPRGS